jgi:plastocyanin
VLSNPVQSGNVRFAFGGGGTIRLGTYVALAGDVSSLSSRDSSERVAWSAGLHLAIPLSPHTFSLQVTNTLVSTLQGVSRGTDGRRYGFEFTIPLTLRRYFGRRAEQTGDSTATGTPSDSVSAVAAVSTDSAAAVSPPPAPAPTTSAPATLPSTAPTGAAARTVRNGMRNLNYLQSRLQVTVGTTVVWKNNDPLPHTVTAVDKSFNSGLIQPGKTYSHTFTKPGTYNFFCMPHPFMRGVIVVKAD